MSYKLFIDSPRTTSKVYSQQENTRTRSYSKPLLIAPLLIAPLLITLVLFGTSLFGTPLFGTSTNHALASPQVTIAADDVVTVPEDSSISIEILANDAPVADLDMESLKISFAPSYGSVSIQPTFDIIYQPFANFWGDDLFEYQICTVDGSNCGTALVSIQVDSVNDQLIATDDSAVAMASVPVEIDVLANDIDHDLDMNLSTLTVISPTVRGVTQIVDNRALYTANEAGGIDQFSYQICDEPASAEASCSIATVQIMLGELDTITEQVAPKGTLNIAPNGVDRNSPPTIRLINGPTNGNALIELDGTISYQPVADFMGTDEFMVEICRVADDCRIIQYSMTVGPMHLHIPFVTL